MKSRLLDKLYCAGTILLGGAPLVYSVWQEVPIPIHILSGINFVAWVGVCLKYISHAKMLDAVDKTFQAMGLTTLQGSLEDKLADFLLQSKRLQKVAHAFQAEGGLSESELGKNLRRIVELAYEGLNARSAELSLYEAESELWSQAMLIGSPSNINSQSMLVEACNEDSSSLKKIGNILVQPIAFAGTSFGALRVELEEEPTSSDREVIELLATQGALMLIDAQFTEELLKMRAKSEESVRAKTGFLANLSHEIRGPLGIVLNGTELLLDGLCGPITDAQRETCNMVKNSADHLLDLVNDVLDYAKVEAGKVTAKPLDIALKPLLSDLSKVIRSQAHAKNHKVVLENVEDTLGVICDKRHIRQMLINFLTNAVKYTPDGGQITIKAQRLANNRVKISVTDTGIGIAETEREKVFNAFERVENQYALAQMGTGLGMPLTVRLAEVNKGTVDFESEEGRGSTFWVNLPAARIEVEQGKSEEGEREIRTRPQGHGETILLVDHDPQAREMLERYLAHQGFQILYATSGTEVTKVLREKRIELAVVENDIPGFPGEDMVAVIRSNPSASKVPIILLSSKAFVFDIERFLKLGVDRCLSKPVELVEVATTARRLIDETRSLGN